jgi:hypothetical protein
MNPQIARAKRTGSPEQQRARRARPPRVEPSAGAQRAARSDEPRGWGPAAPMKRAGSERAEEAREQLRKVHPCIS